MDHVSPIATDYRAQAQIAREQFFRYADVGDYSMAKNIIRWVVKRFPDSPHPLFRVDVAAHKLYIEQKIPNNLLKHYVKQALAHFPDAVYVWTRITMSADLFCYKHAKEGKAKSILLHPGDDDAYEVITCWKAKAIREMCERVTINDIPEEEV